MTVNSVIAGPVVVDAETSAALLAARRGTAFFSRTLHDLTDPRFDEPSTIDGWLRRDVVAYVGYHARRMSELVASAWTHDRELRWNPPTERDVAYGATLPASALRNLHAHTAVHLSVEWRDLPARAWNMSVDSAQGPVTLTDLVWNRAQTVWFGGDRLSTNLDGTIAASNPWPRPIPLIADTAGGPKSHSDL